MSRSTVKHGNIFTSQHQTLVNTVNCHGVMGAGIALEFRLRYPEMFTEYVERCREGEIRIGSLWLCKPGAEDQSCESSRRPGGGKWVLNFPTKNHWRYPSRIEYLVSGLETFLNEYEDMGITSIAFPVLGATNGGIPEDESLELMKRHLDRCKIPVEIYRYDPHARDDLYGRFRDALASRSDDDLSRESGLKRHLVARLRAAVEHEDINSLSRLATVRGIGTRTLERSFRYLLDMETAPSDTGHLADHPGTEMAQQLTMQAAPSDPEPWGGDGGGDGGGGGDGDAAELEAPSHRRQQAHVDHIDKLDRAFLPESAEHDPAGEEP